VPAGEIFRPPIVVEGDHVYFAHNTGGEYFIARAKVPFDGSGIEHYAPDAPGAEESPHFGVTGTTLYLTDYPQPNGDPGAGVIMRVRNAPFEPVE
jgi:hypothetical protein